MKLSKRVADLNFEFGLLYSAISGLASRKPESPERTFPEYLASLGPLQPGEPAVIVRISPDGTHHFKNEGSHDLGATTAEELRAKEISTLEISEDYFYYMKGLHQGSFEIGQTLPSYFYGLGIMHAHMLFEVYLSDVLTDVYQVRAELMPTKLYASYAQATLNGHSTIEIIEQAVRQATFLPLVEVVRALTEKFGFAPLPGDIDEPLRRSSLIRNCIAHGSVVRAPLANAYPEEYGLGETLTPDASLFQRCVETYRNCAVAIDAAQSASLRSRTQSA